MDEAPDLGHQITHDDGRVFERVFSAPEVKVPQAFTARHKGVTSHSLPRNWKHHKGEFSPEGKPRFATGAEAANACARAAHLDGTEVAYGEL